ncbi:Uncharacterised protein [Bordetella pertussis]|nr:Uncharacterised protein [Bordetella pertussis]
MVVVSCMMSSITQAVRGSMARAVSSPALTGVVCIRTLPERSVTRSIR